MTKKAHQLILLGELKPDSGKTHSQNFVYHTGGVCPTLCAKDYKDPKRIVVFQR